MSPSKKQTIGQIVVNDYRKSKVFKKYGIDFCCSGHKTIEAVCKEHKIKANKLLSELENINKKGKPDDSYNNWSLDILVDYIVHNHHQYLRDNLPEIKFYAKTAETIHGDTHRELLRIYVNILKLSDEIMTYMDQEEELLFPFIKRLVSNKNYSNRVEDINSSEITGMMQPASKTEIWNTLATIRHLSKNYQIPGVASRSYKKFYEDLADLDKNLNKHMHLENNILFPKALERTKNFRNKYKQ